MSGQAWNEHKIFEYFWEETWTFQHFLLFLNQIIFSINKMKAFHNTKSLEGGFITKVFGQVKSSFQS